MGYGVRDTFAEYFGGFDDMDIEDMDVQAERTLNNPSYRRKRRAKSRRTRIKTRRRRKANNMRVSGKRKSSTGRRGGVKYTKNGQPYIIMKSGKARFIKGRRHK